MFKLSIFVFVCLALVAAAVETTPTPKPEGLTTTVPTPKPEVLTTTVPTPKPKVLTTTILPPRPDDPELDDVLTSFAVFKDRIAEFSLAGIFNNTLAQANKELVECFSQAKYTEQQYELTTRVAKEYDGNVYGKRAHALSSYYHELRAVLTRAKCDAGAKIVASPEVFTFLNAIQSLFS